MSFGIQVGTYRQLKDAVAFLKTNGVKIRHLPPELSPGIDYSALAIDREAILRSVLRGHADLADSIVAPGFWAHAEGILGDSFGRDRQRIRAD